MEQLTRRSWPFAVGSHGKPFTLNSSLIYTTSFVSEMKCNILEWSFHYAYSMQQNTVTTYWLKSNIKQASHKAHRLISVRWKAAASAFADNAAVYVCERERERTILIQFIINEMPSSFYPHLRCDIYNVVLFAPTSNFIVRGYLEGFAPLYRIRRGLVRDARDYVSVAKITTLFCVFIGEGVLFALALSRWDTFEYLTKCNCYQRFCWNVYYFFHFSIIKFNSSWYKRLALCFNISVKSL